LISSTMASVSGRIFIVPFAVTAGAAQARLSPVHRITALR
jgi:hypothetical protein